MPRLMSVTLTEQAVRDRRKTVTRRLGWKFLKAGDRLTLCRKVMGRKPGEPLERLAEVEVIAVRREPLWAITANDIALEGVEALGAPTAHQTGFPTPAAWVEWFCQEMKVTPDTIVTRIEWRYLEAPAAPPTVSRRRCTLTADGFEPFEHTSTGNSDEGAARLCAEVWMLGRPDRRAAKNISITIDPA